MRKKKRVVKRRKKTVHRRTHYLDQAPLQPAKSAVFLVHRKEKVVGVNSKGLGRIKLFVLGQELKLSDVIWSVKRTLGENAKFEIEPIVSGIFAVEPTCLHGFCNLDGRVFNEKMEVVRRTK